jgi:hypothetical protein
MALLALLLTAGAQAQGTLGPAQQHSLWGGADVCAPETPTLGGAPGLRTYGAVPWYVDSVNGNDANTGRSKAAALQTISALMAKTITNGAVVCLARGSHWDEQLTITANNVTVAAYGAGARPMLDAADSIAGASWSKTGGLANVYQASVAVAAGGIWVNVWENDAYLMRAASAAASDATPGTYFPSAENGAITLYVHATDGGSPAANGKTYDVSVREAGLYAGDNLAGVIPVGVRVSGIRTRREAGAVGSLYLGLNAIATDVVADQGGKHNILIGSGVVARANATDWYWGAGQPIVFDSYTKSAGQSSRFEDATVTSTRGRTLGWGWGGHTNGLVSYVLLECVRCSINGIENAYYVSPAGAADASHLVDCETTDVTRAVFAAVPTTVTRGTFLADKSIVLGASTTVTVSGATLRANIAAEHPVQLTVAGASVSIADSIIQGTAGADTNYGIIVTDAGVITSVLRTTFTSTRRAWSVPAGYANVTADYNDYAGLEQPALGFVIGGVTKTLAEWRTATGQDAHSTPLP